MSRKPIIAGNWKMNKNYGEAVVLAQSISNRMDDFWLNKVDVVVCPPFIDLKPVKTVFEFDRMDVELGAQNVHWEEAGAFTGEISTGMLKNVGCDWCIVGHSERRTLMGETNEDVNRKAKDLIAAGMKPIVCVGESLAVRDAEAQDEFVCAQVDAAFAGIPAASAKSCVVAYEPIWSIGTGRTATPEQAEAMCAAIRTTLARIYDQETADQMRILYGGSMNPGNAEGLLAQENIDGGLIGGAALDADSFVDLVKAAL